VLIKTCVGQQLRIPSQGGREALQVSPQPELGASCGWRGASRIIAGTRTGKATVLEGWQPPAQLTSPKDELLYIRFGAPPRQMGEGTFRLPGEAVPPRAPAGRSLIGLPALPSGYQQLRGRPRARRACSPGS